MNIEQQYIDLNNKIETFLFNRAEYAKVFSTLIPDNILDIITNNEFKIFIKKFDSFLCKSNVVNTIKQYPYLFVVIQTYIISTVVMQDTRSFYEKFYSECRVCEKDLENIFKECQENIWEDIEEKCNKKYIKFFIPKRKTHANRYIQYPASQVILTSAQMGKLLRMLSINPEYKENNMLSLHDFSKIVESNKDIKYRIREMVDSSKYENFYIDQYSIISNQLYSYYLTAYFTAQIIKRNSSKKINQIIHTYTMAIQDDTINIFLVNKYDTIKLKKIQSVFNTKTNDDISYSLWYKTCNDENWIYTNIIYKKYCEYCFLCMNTNRNLMWIKTKLHVTPIVKGIYLCAFLDNEKIKILPTINYEYTDKFFEYPLITGGQKIGRATYLEGFGPKINYTKNALLLINGVKVLNGDYLLNAKPGLYNIQLFIDTHYIKTNINIISDKQKDILNKMYKDNYIYETGEAEPPKNIKENNIKEETATNYVSKNFLYTLIGKKINNQNNSLIKVMEFRNYGNK